MGKNRTKKIQNTKITEDSKGRIREEESSCTDIKPSSSKKLFLCTDLHNKKIERFKRERTIIASTYPNKTDQITFAFRFLFILVSILETKKNYFSGQTQLL
jgi:hypothetical protein